MGEGVATPSLGQQKNQQNRKIRTQTANQQTEKQPAKTQIQTANPKKPANSETEPEKRTRIIGVGPSKHRTSALQRIPLLSGGASPSLKVRAMEWHNFAEILFGLAAVITALKQGGKKK